MDGDEDQLSHTPISEIHTNNILLTEEMVKSESNKKDSDESPLVQKRETVILHTSNVPQFGVGRVEPEKEKEKLSDKKDRKRKSEDGDDESSIPKKGKLLLYILQILHSLEQEGWKLKRKRTPNRKMNS